MKKLRLGLIGMGNIGTYHADYLLQNKVNRCELVAVCRAVPPALEKYRPLKMFADGAQMIQSGDVDAVLIATPHLEHTTLGIAALDAGLHVMVEKPISSHKADAERLIAARRRNPKSTFAGMFQLRTEPRYLQIRRLIRDDLGEIVRVHWLNTHWYRTEAYYASSGWRATWKGEGGGVLLNQCLHNLDLLQWLCGMPKRLRGFCQCGRYHQIEVEDNVTAYLEWANGATGVFIGSTGESPGTNRLEIVGTRGRIILENDRLAFTRNQTDMLEFSKSAKSGFISPESTTADVPFENAVSPHATMMQNFVNAILDGEPLLAPGEEGIHSVELANSMVFSSLLNQTLELPMESRAWEQQLKQLIADSKVKKTVMSVSASDFASSFKR